MTANRSGQTVRLGYESTPRESEWEAAIKELQLADYVHGDRDILELTEAAYQFVAHLNVV